MGKIDAATLKRAHALIESGLRGTFVLMAAVSGALLALSVLVLIVGNRRRRYTPPEHSPLG